MTIDRVTRTDWPFCNDCGHLHAVSLAGICIGCPCPRTVPRVSLETASIPALAGLESLVEKRFEVGDYDSWLDVVIKLADAVPSLIAAARAVERVEALCEEKERYLIERGAAPHAVPLATMLTTSEVRAALGGETG